MSMNGLNVCWQNRKKILVSLSPRAAILVLLQGINRNTKKQSVDSEQFPLENTVFAVYYPIVNARKQGQAAGKSVIKYSYDFIVQPKMYCNF